MNSDESRLRQDILEIRDIKSAIGNKYVPLWSHAAKVVILFQTHKYSNTYDGDSIDSVTGMVGFDVMLQKQLLKNQQAQVLCRKRLKKLLFTAAGSGTPFAIYIGEEKLKHQ